tara:strand:- start:631 stop:885 length:255 start_codon:yes stop_codon:yes gene_type:complete
MADVMLEMMKAIRDDLNTIRDNHLAHIAEDISAIKVEQAEMRKDIDEVMGFKEEVEALVRDNLKKALSVVVVGIGAVVGIPLAL